MVQVHLNEINKNSKVIDLRSSIDFEKFNYPGSINVPKLFILKEPEKFLDKNKKYYFICDQGKVSLSCAKILNALGYNCYSIIGGIDKYKELLKK